MNTPSSVSSRSKKICVLSMLRKSLRYRDQDRAMDCRILFSTAMLFILLRPEQHPQEPS